MNRKVIGVAGIVACALMVSIGPVRGQEPKESKPVAPVRPAAAVGAAKAVSGNERLQFDLEAMPLSAFLRLISDASGMRFVTTPDLAKMEISLYLPDATAKEALDIVCSAYGFSCEPVKDTKIMAIRENMEAAVVRLEYVTAEDIGGLLPTLLSGKCKATIDKKNNLVALSGNPADMARTRQAIRQADQMPSQVLIEATLAELGSDAEKRLGIRWELVGSFRGAARETKLPFKSSYVSLLDDPLAWTYGVVSFQDTLVLLEAQEREGTARILATPRITALNNTEANIRIVTHQVVAKKLTRETGTVNLVTEEPIYADVGVTLRTVPRIHPDGRITLVVEPTVSTAAISTFVAEAVDTFTRSALTTVLLDDGQTYAIGGLLRDDTAKTERRLPYISNALRRVPLLGHLLRHDDTSDTKLDLVVFITPRIMTADRMKAETDESRDRIGTDSAAPEFEPVAPKAKPK